MPEYTIGDNATTNLSGTVQDVKITAVVPDPSSGHGPRTWDYPDAANHLGFVKSVAELRSALKILTMRVCGSGWDAGPKTARLQTFVGWGNDTFSTICENMLAMSKGLGDSFAEIVRDENDDPINLKPLYTGDMKTFADENGMIDRYEQKSNDTWFTSLIVKIQEQRGVVIVEDVPYGTNDSRAALQKILLDKGITNIRFKTLEPREEPEKIVGNHKTFREFFLGKHPECDVSILRTAGEQTQVTVNRLTQCMADYMDYIAERNIDR